MPDKLIALHSDEASDDTTQTGGLPRLAGVDAETTGAEEVWMGRVTGEPGKDSDPHHHGEAETAGYILSGECRIFYGKEYNDTIDLGPGDFVYVPPHVPHIERNLSDNQPVEFVTARTPSNITVNLSDNPDLPSRESDSSDSET